MAWFFWPKHFKNIYKNVFKKELRGTSLVVQWLRLHATNAGGVGSAKKKKQNTFVRRVSVAAGMVGKNK